MLQETIVKNQNSNNMLKCQFSARHYYNLAENYNVAAFIGSLISLSFLLIPDKAYVAYSPIFLLTPSVFDIASLVCYKLMGISISRAALLRNYFDEIVLRTKISNNTDSDIRKINSLIINVVDKSKEECELQISHTGRDNPPGVKNWYEFSKQYADSDVMFECQRQNRWWNNELSHRRIFLYGSVVILVIISGILLVFFSNFSILRVFVCLLSAAITFTDRFIENLKYIRLSMKIDDRCEALEVSKNKALVSSLQELIAKRRELKIVEINHIHKKHSKELSERYEQITKDF